MCCFILNCYGLSSRVAKLQWEDDDSKTIVLFFVSCIILYVFKSCSLVVFKMVLTDLSNCTCVTVYGC
jgi:hypothetical protein